MVSWNQTFLLDLPNGVRERLQKSGADFRAREAMWRQPRQVVEAANEVDNNNQYFAGEARRGKEPVHWYA
jgi:hypothetical protein